MADFVKDDLPLPTPKIDLNTIPAGRNPLNYVSAADWNSFRQAILDLRSNLLGGANAYGLTPQSSDPTPQGVTDYIWLKSDGTLWITFNGTPIQVGSGGGGGLVTVATNGDTSTIVATTKALQANGVLVWGFDSSSHGLDPVVYQAGITDGVGFTISHGPATTANKFFWKAF